MSARGAEGVLAQRKAAGLTATGQPQPAPAQVADAPPKQGRVKSAAKGAAGGSVAGPEGAAAGAVAGLLSGGKGSRGGGNKALVAEFAVCMALLLLSPIVNGGGDVTVGKWMKKASATAAVFIVLGFIATTGQTPRKVATGIGALMTLTVLLNERSVFADLVKAVGGQDVAIPAVGSPNTTPSFNSNSLSDSLDNPFDFGQFLGGQVRDFFTTPASPADVAAAQSSPIGGDLGPAGAKVSGAIQDLNNTLEAAPGDSIFTKIFHGIFG